MSATARLAIAISLLILAIFLLAWGLWPASQVVQTLTIEPDRVQVIPLSDPILLQVTTPRVARLGDSFTARLRLVIPTTWTDKTLPALAHARILMDDDTEVTPRVAVSQPLVSKGDLSFYWHLSARQAGRSQGRLWVHLEVLSPTPETPNREQALAAMPLTVDVHSLLGLSGPTARGLGMLAAVADTLLILVPRLSTTRRVTKLST